MYAKLRCFLKCYHSCTTRIGFYYTARRRRCVDRYYINMEHLFFDIYIGYITYRVYIIALTPSFPPWSTPALRGPTANS